MKTRCLTLFKRLVLNDLNGRKIATRVVVGGAVLIGTVVSSGRFAALADEFSEPSCKPAPGVLCGPAVVNPATV